METKIILFLLADIALILSGYYYGWKFLRKRNYLLGFEWWIIAFSATNFFLFALTETMLCYNISMFLDSFSRAFGFPVIGTIGIMTITHQYSPSKQVDIGIFALSFAGTCILMYTDIATDIKPWLYLFSGTAFAFFLAYFTLRLIRAGETLNALNLAGVMATSLAIGIIYDFFKIPGDDADKTLFYTLALATWSYMLVGIYHAYCALERSEES